MRLTGRPLELLLGDIELVGKLSLSRVANVFYTGHVFGEAVCVGVIHLGNSRNSIIGWGKKDFVIFALPRCRLVMQP